MKVDSEPRFQSVYFNRFHSTGSGLHVANSSGYCMFAVNNRKNEPERFSLLGTLLFLIRLGGLLGGQIGPFLLRTLAVGRTAILAEISNCLTCTIFLFAVYSKNVWPLFLILN